MLVDHPPQKKYIVITPVRDEAEYIRKTLDSVIGQTIRPIEWIIVNDGSKDETGEIVRGYTQDYPWIKLITQSDRKVRQRGKGVVEAFYAGFTILQEDYEFIVKLDGDVSFDPDYFENLLASLPLTRCWGLLAAVCMKN